METLNEVDTPTEVKTTRVYKFGNKTADGNSTMRNLLGGKGANLAEMNLIGIPVPPGFTITTGKPSWDPRQTSISALCLVNA